jgi:hypothetical protein
MNPPIRQKGKDVRSRIRTPRKGRTQQQSISTQEFLQAVQRAHKILSDKGYPGAVAIRFGKGGRLIVTGVRRGNWPKIKPK